MHPFAPKKPTSESGHPGDEELAAYVDGMLGEEDAARVAGHLAACADCYRVCSETLRFQLEEGEKEEENVVPFRSGRKVKTPWPPIVAAAAVAAAAVLMVGVGAGLFTLFGPAPEMTTAELVEPLPSAVGELWMGPRLRGGGEEIPNIEQDLEWRKEIERQFQIGVQLVNLQVGLERNDKEIVEGQVLPRLVGLLDEDLVASLVPEYEKYYTDLRVAIGDGAAPSQFLQESSRMSEELRELLEAPSLELGRFVEAGRLAAIARQPSFFERRGVRRLLRDLLKQQEEGELDLDPEALRSLEAISEQLRGDLQAADYEVLKENFETILGKQYPQS